MESRLRRFAEDHGSELCAAVEEAKDLGLTIKANAQGVDVSGLSARAQETLFNAYVPDTGDEARDSGDFEVESVDDQRMVFEEDKAMMRKSFERLRPVPTNVFDAALIHSNLHRFGFHKINSFPGLEVERLKAEVIAKLHNNGVWEDDEGITAVGTELDHLRPVLDNPHLLRAASDYFGGEPSELTGYEIVHLGPRLTPEQYGSGLWHHDRCGRRLKLFVYIDDVGERDHPTMIAQGTHNYTWFGMQNYAPTRFRDDWVKLTYGEERLMKMTAPKGGGFFFDTNTIHRGDIDGIHSARNVIIVEYHTKKRIEDDGWRNRDCVGTNNHNVHKDIHLPPPSHVPRASSPPLSPSSPPPLPYPLTSPAHDNSSPQPRIRIPSRPPPTSTSDFLASSPLGTQSRSSEVVTPLVQQQHTNQSSNDGVIWRAVMVFFGLFLLLSGVAGWLFLTRKSQRVPTRSNQATVHRHKKPKGSQRLPEHDDIECVQEEFGQEADGTERDRISELAALGAENQQLRLALEKLQAEKKGHVTPMLQVPGIEE